MFILAFLAACGHGNLHGLSCEEAEAEFTDEAWQSTAMENAEAEGIDITSAECAAADPDQVDVSRDWWKVCGDYYDARVKVEEECCPDGTGFATACEDVRLP